MLSQKSPGRVQRGGDALPSLGQPPGCQGFLDSQVGTGWRPNTHIIRGGDNEVERVRRDNRVVRYFRETRAELRKVVWPSRKEATRLSAIVVGVTVGMSVFLGAVDLLFSRLIGLIVR